MKRPYDTAFTAAPLSERCASWKLPPELWLEVMKQLCPASPIRNVRYGEGPHPWSAVASLAQCCRFLNQLASDVLYGHNSTFVFDVAADDSLPLFLLRLSDSHLAKIKSVEIVYTGSYPCRWFDISPGLDLLLKCTSLQSVTITGLPAFKSLRRIFTCFRLQSFETLYRTEHAKWPRLSDEMLARVTSVQARTRKEQLRVDESKVHKLNRYKLNNSDFYVQKHSG